MIRVAHPQRQLEFVMADRFECCQATVSDAARIAEIHMATLGSNAMLRAQFPSPTIRQALQICIAEKAEADIMDKHITVLVVRHVGSDGTPKVIAFAKWSHPIVQDEQYVEAPWALPEGTDYAVLNAWLDKIEVLYQQVVGDSPCYRKFPEYVRMSSIVDCVWHRCSSPQAAQAHVAAGLTYIATDPLYQRCGAGSLLLDWGVEQSKTYGHLLELESTLDAADFYQRRRFESRGSIHLQYIYSETGQTEEYEESMLVFTPPVRGELFLR